ncbi:hypothetical protein [Paenibacillus sp. GCM10023250]|uniref:hypothetical protein n=1 Tax=Paenibacillus sp. GCM10023250 TaxID=3252648 RepID=UPI0036221C1E
MGIEFFFPIDKVNQLREKVTKAVRLAPTMLVPLEGWSESGFDLELSIKVQFENTLQ